MNLHPSHQIQSTRFGGAKRPTLHTRGLAVARLLSGAWREVDERGYPPATTTPRGLPARGPRSADGSDISEAELTEITPLLCRSGAGALAWSQLRDTALADCPAAQELREVYRRQRLSALLHEREIAQVITLLRAEGIEPVLIKGWAIARRYPDRALRPYGDIDLCVRPDQYARAGRVLERIASINGPFVDLHCGFTGVGQTKAVQSPMSKVQSLPALRRLWTLDIGLWTSLWTSDGDDWDELFERSQVVQIPNSKFQSPTSSVQSQLNTGSAGVPPADRVAVKDSSRRSDDRVAVADSSDDRAAVKDSSRGLSAWRDTPGSVRINAPDPEGVKQDFGRWTLDLGPSVPVRVLRDEDHLRVLCRHLLRSGAHRPPWLCDVALLLEEVQSPKSKVQSPLNTGSAGVSPADRVAVADSSRRSDDRVAVADSSRRSDDRLAVADSSRGLSAWRDTPGSDRINVPDPEGVKQDFGHWTLDLGPSFDWDICLGRNPLDANWIGVAVGLAHKLLGARIDHTPFANQKLPAWLAPAVLEQWGGKRSVRWAVGSGQTEVRSQGVVQSPKSKVQSPRTCLTPSGSETIMEPDPGVSRQALDPRLLSLTATRLSKRRTFGSGLWTLDFGPWTNLDFGLWTNLYHRWDNPIRSTAAVGGRFDERSRLPYRLLESAMRIGGRWAVGSGQRKEGKRQRAASRKRNPQIAQITQKSTAEM